MNMTKFAFAGATLAVMTTLAVGNATASTLDFTTTTYNMSFPPLFGSKTVGDSAAGVNFTVTATARGVDGFRQAVGRGLTFGVPGNGMFSISITADKDVTYNSMFGKGHGQTQFAGQLPFDVGVGGSPASNDLMFTSTALETVAFGSGPIFVAAGVNFKFKVDFNALFGSSSHAPAVVKSFDFTVSTATLPSPVPLPAGFPLLMAGLGALGFLRKKRK